MTMTEPRNNNPLTRVVFPIRVPILGAETMKSTILANLRESLTPQHHS